MTEFCDIIIMKIRDKETKLERLELLAIDLLYYIVNRSMLLATSHPFSRVHDKKFTVILPSGEQLESVAMRRSIGGLHFTIVAFTCTM